MAIPRIGDKHEGMTLLKGLIHVHSNYSYDGQHSIHEIAQLGRERGYSFIGMTEHSDTLDKEKVALYVEECRKVSSPECLIIPGIEFSCDNNLHLIGLGVRHYTDSKNPLEVSAFIQQEGGVAIIAHPKRYNYHIPSELAAALDGIEVWNACYDGRFVPNDRSLNLLKNFRKRKGSLLAFGGQDLHRITNHSHVQVGVTCEGSGDTAILTALKKGTFIISNCYFRVTAQSDPGCLKTAHIVTARRTYELAKGMRDLVRVFL